MMHYIIPVVILILEDMIGRNEPLGAKSSIALVIKLGLKLWEM